MDIAAFQSLFPEEVRIETDRHEWCGEDLQYYDVESDVWESICSGAEILMCSEKDLNFSVIDGLVKSSIIAQKDLAIQVVGDLVGIVRGNNLHTKDDLEMEDFALDMTGEEKKFDAVDYEAPDMFSPEKELRELL